MFWWNVEVWAVQKYVDLVDLVKCLVLWVCTLYTLRSFVSIFIFHSLTYFSSIMMSPFSQSLFRTRSLFQRVFTCENRRRFSRERASQNVEVLQFIYSFAPLITILKLQMRPRRAREERCATDFTEALIEKKSGTSCWTGERRIGSTAGRRAPTTAFPTGRDNLWIART